MYNNNNNNNNNNNTNIGQPMAERVEASVLGGCVGGLCGLLRAWVPEHQRQSSPGLEYLSSRCAAGCS